MRIQWFRCRAGSTSRWCGFFGLVFGFANHHVAGFACFLQDFVTLLAGFFQQVVILRLQLGHFALCALGTFQRLFNAALAIAQCFQNGLPGKLAKDEPRDEECKTCPNNETYARRY